MMKATVCGIETFVFAKALPASENILLPPKETMKQRNRFLLLLAVFSLSTFLCFAQRNNIDVLFFKNGSILRGKVVERNATGGRIQINGGSVFIYRNEELDSSAKESFNDYYRKHLRHQYVYKTRGYANYTEVSGLMWGNGGTDAYGNTRTAFGLTLHTINGYRIWPYLFVGAGLGIDRYYDYKETFSPFYLRLTCEPLKRKLSPLITLDAGYSYLWKKWSEKYNWYKEMDYKTKGGYYVACAAGLRVNTQGPVAFTATVGYRAHQSSFSYYQPGWQGEGYLYETKRLYQRVTLSLGLSF